MSKTIERSKHQRQSSKSQFESLTDPCVYLPRVARFVPIKALERRARKHQPPPQSWHEAAALPQKVA